MGVDIRVKFFKKELGVMTLFIDEAFKSKFNKKGIYMNEVVGNRYYPDIIEGLKDKYEIATPYNTPLDLEINYNDSSYHLPIVMKIKDIIDYKSNPYNHEDGFIEHYKFLYEHLKNDFNLNDNNIDSIYIVIDFF